MTTDESSAPGAPIGRRRAVVRIAAALVAATTTASGVASLVSCRTARESEAAGAAGPRGPGRLTARPRSRLDARADRSDFIRGPYGPDVEFIDRALKAVFRRRAVDPSRVAIEGFSDGASYALSLGMTNGDLFGRVVAFSPCIVAPAATVGRPRIFLSHRTRDRILPIESCGRPIVTRLRSDGYDVRFREFDGPHAVPPDVAAEALDWLAAAP